MPVIPITELGVPKNGDAGVCGGEYRKRITDKNTRFDVRGGCETVERRFV